MNVFTEKEILEIKSKQDVKEIRFFIILMIKSIYLGICFVLIVIPLHTIFG